MYFQYLINTLIITLSWFYTVLKYKIDTLKNRDKTIIAVMQHLQKALLTQARSSRKPNPTGGNPQKRK